MTGPERHFEPFVHLVDLTDTSVLIAWGGFFFERTEAGWLVVDDDDLDRSRRRRGGTIGAASASYGAASVEVLDRHGEVVALATSDDANHAWVHGLEPDTAYGYRVLVDGRSWLEAERWDWQVDGGPLPSDRPHDLRFRTHPHADDPEPVTFLAFGDYGVGITNGEAGRRQLGVARTLEALASTHPVRFLVGLGDHIYHGEEDALAQSGDEDDDWYLTFYEPYRSLIERLPLYPAAGNHDGSDEEASDDRAQLRDNFHLDARFGPEVAEGRAVLDPGLFFALRVGALLELVCVDTSWGAEIGIHDFEDERARRWLEQVLPPRGSPDADEVWRIPFCHHPAYCAGPHHENMAAQIETLVPLYRRAGVPLVLSGHEHNFQHGVVDGIHHVVSGAAGKLQDDPPTRWDDAGTVGWASVAHCLLVEVAPDQVAVTPYGATDEGEEPRPVEVRDREGRPVDARIVIRREAST